MLTPEDWLRLDVLFHQALDLPPERRETFVEEACADEPDLCEQLQRLVRAHEAAPEFLEDAPLAGSLEMALEGERIGPYRLKHVLGRGGMGTVYLAARDDLPRPVALKIIRRELDTEPLRARFLREQRILATLDHPNIARVYDGGVTEDGRPYFVMEYVEGQPIDTYCDAHRLDVPARLALFQTVCQAVQAAHQRLIVHRDLKPSNVLVAQNEAGEPTVKLLDFGIAKLLGPAADDDELLLTRTGAPVMTPAYAAPEQVRGDVVTTAADVYALGALLYELLTGRRPYRLASRARREVERAILETEPTRPSTAVQTVAPRETRAGLAAGPPSTANVAEAETIAEARATTLVGLRKRLRGDLDHIVLKALRKQPTARYDTPTALAADIGRHLEGLPPEESRGEAWRYRARRFVRRNRRVVGVTLAIVAALAVGLGAALWQARVAQAERDRARTEAAKQSEMKRFVLSLFDVANPVKRGFGEVSVRALIDSGAVSIPHRLHEQPEVQAEMYSSLGEIYRRLGEYARADSLLREAVRLAPPSGTPADTVRADYLRKLGVLASDRADYGEAAAFYDDALRIVSASLPEGHDALVQLTNELGLLRWRMGDYDEAIRLHTRVLAARRAEVPADTQRLSSALNNLAVAYWYDDQLAEAEPILAEALALRRAYFGSAHPSVALTLVNLANLIDDPGRHEEAEVMLKEALAIRREVFSDGHPATASAAVSVGVNLHKQGRSEEGLALVREALRVRRAALGPDHPLTGDSELWLAVVLEGAGRGAEAVPHAREAVRIALASRGEAHDQTHETMLKMADVLRGAGHAAEARRLAQNALRLLEAHHPEDTERLGEAREVIAAPSV